MHIKQITIKGFRSYREQTSTQPFSHNHNVVVGRNGSGKSNFFFAIRFVLSDGFSNLRTEERLKLLHQGAGHAVSSAFVEIVFDNTDGRIPIDKEEVALRRAISVKTDDYYLDNKRIQKSEVLNLLESAGFSRSNPYYIVQQGKITTLADSTDKDRLQLLMEVAGTSVYDERRKESLDILDDTHSKQQRIDEVLKSIQERLDGLETEKEELKTYQELDRKKRTVDFALYTLDRKAIENRARQLEERRAQLSRSTISENAKTADIEREILTLEGELRETLVQVEVVDDQLTKIAREMDEKQKELAELKAQHEEVQQNVADTETKQSECTAKLQEVTTLIERKRAELTNVVPQFDKLTSELQAKTEQLKDAEEKRDVLLQQTEFETEEEKKETLNMQIEKCQKAMQENRQLLQQTNSQTKSFEGSLAAKKETLEKTEEQLASLKDGRVLTNKTLQDLNKTKTTLQAKRRAQQNEADVCESSLNLLRDKLRDSEKRLMDTTKRQVREGTASIRHIVEKKGITGVYGPLIDLIEVHEDFIVPADVTAGNALFNIVVDTDATASVLLRHMNSERLPGRVTFMPLNRLKPPNTRFPEVSEDQGVPLIDYIDCDPAFAPAAKYIFGRTFVVPELFTGDKFAAEYNIDVITLDGNKVSSKNVFSGGFIDPTSNKLRLHTDVKQFRTQLQEEEQKQKKVLISLAEVDEEFMKVSREIQETQRESTEAAAKVREMQASITILNKEITALQGDVREGESRIAKFEANIFRQTKRIAALKEELGKALHSSQLNTQEQEQTKELSEQIEDLRKELQGIIHAHSEAELLKNRLEIEINNNLSQKQQQLLQEVERLETNAVDADPSFLEESLTVLQKDLAKLQESQTSLVAQRGEHEEARASLDEKLSGARRELNECHELADTGEDELVEIAAKMRQLNDKKEQIIDDINSLGPLPSASYEQYANKDKKSLYKLQSKVNGQLQKYKHVNKKALDQYMTFSEQRDALTGRKEEQQTGHDAITNLIRTLDAQKNEAINFTFKQVASHFERVFKELVPDGSAKLVMIRDKSPAAQESAGDSNDSNDNSESAQQQKSSRSDDEDASEDEGDSDGSTNTSTHSSPGSTQPSHAHLRNANTLQYSGVAMKVRFTPNPESETSNIHQLSGGQKSLVALALIFAIQRSDPAPFYLFDEIDQALDPAHREAVAEMIFKASRGAQYITTTFRLELLARCDKCYGVTFINNASRLELVTKDRAIEFINTTTE